MATDASGRSTAKLATFETASKRIAPDLNWVKNSSRRLCRVDPVKSGTSSSSASSRSCSTYIPMIRVWACG